MNTQAVLLQELESTLLHGTSGHNAAMAQRIASLFLDGGFAYSTEQIALFDDVLSRLMECIEATVRADLALRLCDARAAPPRLLRQLALDDIIEVAAPLLSRCRQLDDGVLIECVDTHSQDHLLAISRRQHVSEAVTDRLVTRGDVPVLQSCVENPGTRFSNYGFATLVSRAEGNDTLAVRLGGRADLPRHHFLRLLSIASDAVQEHLKAADPQNVRAIEDAVARVTDALATHAVGGTDFGAAMHRAHALQAAGTLGDREILQYVADGRTDDIAATIATLAGVDPAEVERAMLQKRPEPLLTLLRAVDLGWPTARALLKFRRGGLTPTGAELELALASFARLSPDTARQALALKRRQTTLH